MPLECECSGKDRMQAQFHFQYRDPRHHADWTDAGKKETLLGSLRDFVKIRVLIHLLSQSH